MDKEEIILVGGGGHCKSVIDVLEAEDRYRIAGIVDVKEKVGQKILGYKIIAADDEIEKLCKSYSNFILTIGQIKSSLLRNKLFNMLKTYSIELPVIISPFARVSRHSIIGEGSVIMHNVIINSGVRIGDNCIINTASILEHDAVVGNHCHISTGALINGGCIVEENTFIGSNSTLAHGVRIKANNIIGAGSVILRDTEASAMYAGNPAIFKKTI